MQGIHKAGYDVATPIQQAAIPAALRGRDIIGTAQTGTGKTAAFVLPILNKLLEGQRNTPRALIVTPTRELAEQIHDVIKTLSAGTRLKSATIYGGVGAAPQIQALRNGAEILVACPGRLLDLIAQGHAKMTNIEILVLDEADRMFDMGFLPDVRRIVKAVPEKRQTMMFSATFPPDVELLAQQALRQPQKIAMGIVKPAHTVAHALYPVPPHLKATLLIELLKHTDTNSVIVFTRTKHRAHRVAQQIKRAGFNATSLHGDRSQGQRQAAIKGFKSGHHDIMVATDIAARGLDIETVSHVINFDMPDTADAYIHRIGRTGRAQRTGDAFTLVTDDDKDMIRTLERIMGAPLERKTLEGFDYARPAPPRTDHGGRGRGAPRNDSRRPPKPAPTPKSFGKNRLAPRKK
ncbi:MAG: RNA helicase [Chloroflexi bacterium]|nr:ATP-dependent RNA helicase RhlE [Anaerolineales bacterium]MCE7920301.1 DEAD/DEAH box helicase [Chloroflexi bacterium CFX1]MCQ3954019.1 ATP-dependent helicase [Chloroflexota bacterium]MDL1918062.1 DEAD/DEAH box helicase [Chloroflexi bacterium CFX5]NUQ60024.1 DEAD/DEAH box helicase [Anaerolineales bacterium]